MKQTIVFEINEEEAVKAFYFDQGFISTIIY